MAFSDKSELSGEYLNTTRENFLRSMLISCFSFTEVAKEASKVMKQGGSLLTLTYESTKAIPNYNVMGCLLYTSPSPRDVEESRMPSSA